MGADIGAAGVTDTFFGQCGSKRITLTILEDKPAYMIICMMHGIHSCSLAAGMLCIGIVARVRLAQLC